MKAFKQEIVDNDEILKIFNEIVEENKTIKDLKKDYPDQIEKLEGALFNYMGENDPKFLKTEVPDNKRKYLTKKLANPYEYSSICDDYKKPVDNLQKRRFLQ